MSASSTRILLLLGLTGCEFLLGGTSRSSAPDAATEAVGAGEPLAAFTIDLSKEEAVADGADAITVTVTPVDRHGGVVEVDLPFATLSNRYAATELALVPAQGGTYTADVYGTLATGFEVLVESGDVVSSASLTLVPGPPALVDLEIPPGAYDDMTGGLSTVATFTLHDAYGNLVEVDPADYTLTADGLEVEVVARDALQLEAVIDTDGWGVVPVVVQSLDGSVVEEEDARFHPASWTRVGAESPMDRGVVVGESLTVDLTMEVPAPHAVNSFELAFVFDSDQTYLASLEGNPDSGCVLDGFDVMPGDNEAMVWAWGRCADIGGSLSPLRAEFVFDEEVILPMAFDIEITDMYLYTPDWGFLSPNMDLEGESIFQPLNFLPKFKLKPKTSVSVTIRILEGHTTQAEAEKDVAKANEVFLKNALACTCDHLYMVEAEYVEVTKADWTDQFEREVTSKALRTRFYGELLGSKGERVDLYSSDRYNIYYGELRSGKAGVARGQNLPPNDVFVGYAFVNKRKDASLKDHLTLAHELGHLLANHNDAEVYDSPHAQGKIQGARTHGNLYNYATTGPNLTKEQCSQFTTRPL